MKTVFLTFFATASEMCLWLVLVSYTCVQNKINEDYYMCMRLLKSYTKKKYYDTTSTKQHISSNPTSNVFQLDKNSIPYFPLHIGIQSFTILIQAVIISTLS